MKTSILKQLKNKMMAFGLAMGIIFPVYAHFFVNWKSPLMLIFFVIGALMAGAIVGIVNFYLVKTILVKDLFRILNYSEKISSKDLTASIELKSDDEIGNIVDALNKSTDNIKALVENVIMVTEDLENSTASLCNHSKDLTHNSKSVTLQSRQIHNSINSIKEDAPLLLSGIDKLKSSFLALTGSVDELDSSIQEVSKESREELVYSRDAFKQAGVIRDRIEKLEKASENINSIVEVISSIAGETNLLALNATIESARAGEAGKGFSVVANEVKELSKQTNAATSQIATQIANIQSIISESVHDISAIYNTIELLSSASQRVEKTVLEQSEKLNTIHSGIQDMESINETLFNGVNKRSTDINEVGNDINQIDKSIEKSQNSANELESYISKVKILLKSLSGKIKLFKI